MRRRVGNFAWVSMMDLLFGVFGALIVLLVLITLKLGRDEPITRRPFYLVVAEITPPENDHATSTFKDVLKETYLAFETEDEPIRWSATAAAENSSGPERFVSASDAATGKVSAALFVPQPDPKAVQTLRPVLRNTARILEWSLQPGTDNIDLSELKVTFRLSVKSADHACDLLSVSISVSELLERGQESEALGAHLIPYGNLGGSAPDGTGIPCGEGSGITLKEGDIVLEQISDQKT